MRSPVVGFGIENDRVRKGFCDRFADRTMVSEDDKLFVRVRFEKI